MTDIAIGSAGVQPIPRSRLSSAIADTVVMTKRHVLHTFRIPDLLVGSTIQPIMFVLLFRYVFGGAINVGSFSYVDYLMAGIFVQTIIFGSMATGIGLADDMQKGVIDRFRSLPMAKSAVLTGRTIADQVRNLISVTVMLIVGFAVGLHLHGNWYNWIFALLLVVAFGYVMSWFSALIGLYARTVEATQQFAFTAVFPLTFASSAFVQTESMPSWLERFAVNQPVTQVIDAVRALMLGTPVGNHVWVTLAWCVGLMIVIVPLAVRRYRVAVLR